MNIRLKFIVTALAIGNVASAGPEAFIKGPAIDGFGPVASVEGTLEIPSGSRFKIAFDVSEAAEPGSISRRLETAARVLNMHARAGLEPDQTEVAIVVHGKAAMDLVSGERNGSENANATLIAALIDAGVTIQLCGQTAAYYDIAVGDLLPGVSMHVSAITAHALLQQQGYTLNPF